MTDASVLPIGAVLLRNFAGVKTRGSLVFPSGLFFVMGISLLTGCSGVSWERSYNAGIQQMAEQRVRAIVMFTSGIDADCVAMDRDVFTDENVVTLMKKFVPIRLDYLLNKSLADQFGVQQIPTFIVIRPDGSIAGSISGKMPTDRFRVFLITHSYN